VVTWSADVDAALDAGGVPKIREAMIKAHGHVYDANELMLPLPNRALDAAALARLVEEFHAEHERTYGYAIRDERVELGPGGLVRVGFLDRQTVYALRTETMLRPIRAGWRCESGQQWSGTHLVFMHERKGAQTGLIYGRRPPDPVAAVQALRANALIPAWQTLTADDVRRAHNGGLTVYPWTVDTAEQVGAMWRLGLDGFMTNDVALARRAAYRAERRP